MVMKKYAKEKNTAEAQRRRDNEPVCFTLRLSVSAVGIKNLTLN